MYFIHWAVRVKSNMNDCTRYAAQDIHILLHIQAHSAEQKTFFLFLLSAVHTARYYILVRFDIDFISHARMETIN